MPEAPAAETEFHPATQSELSRWLADNSAGAQRPVFPVGGRTSLHYGYPAAQEGQTVCTTGLDRVIDFPARDMTVTVEAGIRIDQLQQLLATERQRLPIDIPQAHRATLGGVLATNTSGSRRYGLGTIRDAVIGLSAVDARGRLFKSGGRVVKNVAGYDLCKMLIGSLGTLAVVSQVTLKLRPIPERSALLWIPLGDWPTAETILERLNTSATRPVAIDLFNRTAAEEVASDSGLSLAMGAAALCVGVEGGQREVDWQLQTLESEIGSLGPTDIQRVSDGEADALWLALAEFQVESDQPACFKASLRPSRTVHFLQQAASLGCALQAHAGSGIVYGQLPDSTLSADAARAIIHPLRQAAEECGGSLVLLSCEESWKESLPVFGRATPAVGLMQALKRQLDPRGLLNPRRLFGDL